MTNSQAELRDESLTPLAARWRNRAGALMDSVEERIRELERDPARFRATGGYERLLELLGTGCNPAALKRALRADAGLAGDLLWTICELEDVAAFVPEAAEHVSSDDPGTAAYALEVVIRGSHDSSALRPALNSLSAQDDVVVEAAVRVLASEGLARLEEIFDSAGWMWAAELAREFRRAPFRREVLDELVPAAACERRIVGLVLATLAAEHDPSALECLLASEHAWIRDYGEWLGGASGARSGDEPSR